METKKINILFLLPGPIYRPFMPDFRDKYTMLSQDFSGAIISWTANPDYQDYQIGDFTPLETIGQHGKGKRSLTGFTFYGLLIKPQSYLEKIKFGILMIQKALRLDVKKGKFNIIVCYDPLFTGIIGVILKYLMRCRLIIEVNGNLLNADFLGKISLAKRLKRLIYRLFINLTLSSADTIKVLNNEQRKALGGLSNNKKVFHFHAFVPTNYFMNTKNGLGKNILFVGHPFYLKGVDVLIKAFNLVSGKYPDFVLKLVGFQLEKEARKYFPNLNGKIKFCLPTFYDKIKEEFLKCYCLVLPSREEAMGRVLLEAMSSAKPVIGARVGGIKEVISDGYNGFLFERENIEDLASRLDILLANPQLAKRMGERGKELIKEKFSSEKYCELFKNMAYAALRN